MSVWRTLAKLAGYGLFYCLVLALAVYWMFPWEKAKDRLEGLLTAKLGHEVQIDELSPYRLTGLELTGVAVHLVDAKGEAATEEEKAPEAPSGVSKGGAPDPSGPIREGAPTDAGRAASSPA